MLSSFPSLTTSLASTTTHKEEGQRSDEGKDKTQPLPLETLTLPFLLACRPT